MSKYVVLTTPSQLSTLANKNTIVVIDFHATWCGPCKVIAPVFESLSSKHATPGKIAFAKVDVDAAAAIAQQYNVRAMPTFVILSSGVEADRIQGADRSGLTSAVERHVRTAKPSYSGTGYTLSSASAPKAPAYISNSRVVSGAPLGWRVGSWFDTVVRFVVLYLVSLFSLDAIPAGAKSAYAVGPGPGDGPGGPGGPGGRKLGTVAQVRGKECAGGNCG